MQRYWSSLRYSFLRTLLLLAADYVVIQHLSRAGFLSFPAPFSCVFLLSQSTGILGIPLPALLSNTCKGQPESRRTAPTWRSESRGSDKMPRALSLSCSRVGMIFWQVSRPTPWAQGCDKLYISIYLSIYLSIYIYIYIYIYIDACRSTCPVAAWG